MDLKGARSNDVAIFLFVVVALGIGWYVRVKKEAVSALPHRYVIGEVVEKYDPASGNTIIAFEYVLGQKTYFQKDSAQAAAKAEVGDRYFVSVPMVTDAHGDLKVQDQGVILWEQPVPDSLSSAPPEGWETLPIETVR